MTLELWQREFVDRDGSSFNPLASHRIGRVAA
jgi:hypothetical protein